MTKTQEVSNSEDVIDSRDVIERIEYLDQFGVDEKTDDEVAERAALLEFAEEAEPYAPDWRDGCTLIRDSYFEDYARELAEDITEYDTMQERWPYTCIDWKKAASELQQDYNSVEFDGVTYWVR
jgi:hypothetical protein